MSEHDLNWKYVDESVVEHDVIARARQQSLELGVEPVSPAMGAQLAVIAAASRAESIIEVGTGIGVSGLWLLRAAPTALLTSIDTETEYQQHARQHFADAGVAPARIRLITGRASEVLPRMNEASYDLVFLDADAPNVIEYVEHGLRLAKAKGSVIVARSLWKGRVADPARRDEAATAFRTLIGELAASSAVVTATSPAGDGLLQIVKLGA
ncbi:methyltransferase domain-containing protein [Agromyces sp. CFH 90414]|uniref:Methyltransferase domain-containing protein n=1 Tax=Agromyces agglutinans TaxID=2662258 RepID=A0A6I2FE26_9MICO|nr:O-methyltransferase [Agromyces agglutinans]MRG60776.1 methyltransferase domain-containing protein [Agromyces agglutinans]